MNNAPWRISVAMPTEMATEIRARSIWFWAGAISLATLIAGLLAVVFDRAIERPLAGAAASAETLSLGQVETTPSAGIIEIDRLTDALRDAGARQRLLIAELSHRVRNILAVVQVLVLRSLSDERPIAESRDLVEARLRTLAQTHDLLVKTDWRGVPIGEMIAAELMPFIGRADIDGPELVLQPSVGQSLALIVHELATNAVKHGALSTDTGAVRVTWSVKEDNEGPRFYFSWRERGGPPAKPPARKGFGTMLLQMALPGHRTAPRSSYDDRGFSYEFDVPLSSVVAGEPADGANAQETSPTYDLAPGKADAFSQPL